MQITTQILDFKGIFTIAGLRQLYTDFADNPKVVDEFVIKFFWRVGLSLRV